MKLVNDCYKHKIDLAANGTIIRDALVFVQNHKKDRRKDDSNKTQVKENNDWVNETIEAF